MRRPQPLPTPPRKEPEVPETEIVAPSRRGRKAKAAVPDIVTDPDLVDTAVDGQTLDDWAIADSTQGDTAPVIPIDVAERDVAETTADSATEDVAGQRIRAVDVWKASFARRKALRSEVRRFTGRARRRRLITIVSVAAVVALIAGSFAVAYSPLFAVDKITVSGTALLDAKAIEDALASQHGVPLASIDESEIKSALVKFPMIETYAIEAHPPHELVVRIVERKPIGVVKSGGGYTLVDAAGVSLATTPEVPAGTAVIDAKGGIDSEAFAAIGRVMRALPADVLKLVTSVSATTANDVQLSLGGTSTTVIWGSERDSVEKAIRLQAAMKARPPATASVYDVSSPDAIVVR